MGRTVTFAVITLVSALATPVVVNAMTPKPRAAFAPVTTAAPKAAAEPTCTRQVRVVYAGSGLSLFGATAHRSLLHVHELGFPNSRNSQACHECRLSRSTVAVAGERTRPLSFIHGHLGPTPHARDAALTTTERW